MTLQTSAECGVTCVHKLQTYLNQEHGRTLCSRYVLLVRKLSNLFNSLLRIALCMYNNKTLHIVYSPKAVYMLGYV